MKNKVRQLLVIFTLLITILGACTAPSNSDRVTESQPERVTGQPKESLETEAVNHSIETAPVSEPASEREDSNQEKAAPENVVQENLGEESSEPAASEAAFPVASQETTAPGSQEPASQQHSGLSYEDFQGFYVTFESKIYNSRPQTIVEILPGEIRIGWPESEYIPYQVVGHTINGSIMAVQTNEIDFDGEIGDPHTFEFSLDTSQGDKVLIVSGIEYYAISQEDYNQLIQHSYTY